MGHLRKTWLDISLLFLVRSMTVMEGACGREVWFKKMTRCLSSVSSACFDGCRRAEVYVVSAWCRRVVKGRNLAGMMINGCRWSSRARFRIDSSIEMMNFPASAFPQKVESVNYLVEIQNQYISSMKGKIPLRPASRVQPRILEQQLSLAYL